VREREKETDRRLDEEMIYRDRSVEADRRLDKEKIDIQIEISSGRQTYGYILRLRDTKRRS
jgi:hypothetical protein